MNNDPFGLIIFGGIFIATLVFWWLYFKGHGIKLFESDWRKTRNEIQRDQFISMLVKTLSRSNRLNLFFICILMSIGSIAMFFLFVVK